MGLRYYRNGPQRTLAAAIANSTDTSMTVDSVSGFPTQFPYTLILEPDTALEEVVDVTAAVGNTLTIVRGVDSTTASAHGAGTPVYHGISARDAREANAHVNATNGAHGAVGVLVDTDGFQTINGRKLFADAESVAGGNFIDTASAQSITGAKTFDSLSTTAGGAVVDAGTAQTINGAKTFNGAVTFKGAVTVGGLALYPEDYRVATADIATPLNGAWGNVTGFSFNAVAGAVYAIDSVVFIENPSSSGVDIRFGYSFPAGRMTAGQSGLAAGVVAPAYSGNNTAHAVIASSTSPLDEATGLGAPAGVPSVARLAATFFCTAAGTVQLRFRQHTADASFATRVKDGSRMQIQRIS